MGELLASSAGMRAGEGRQRGDGDPCRLDSSPVGQHEALTVNVGMIRIET